MKIFAAFWSGIALCAVVAALLHHEARIVDHGHRLNALEKAAEKVEAPQALTLTLPTFEPLTLPQGGPGDSLESDGTWKSRAE